MEKKKLFAAVLVMLVLCLTLAGCGGKKEDPETSIKVYTKALLHEDDEALKKVGMKKEDVHKELRDGFADGFLSTSGGYYTREQANRIAESYIKKLKKVDIGASGAKVDGDTATVELSVSQIDMTPLNDASLIRRLQRELVKHKEIKTREQKLDFATDFLAKTVEELNVTGAKSIVVECKYDGKIRMWVPKDPEKFKTDLDEALVKG